jgi:hypothetical protein
MASLLLVVMILGVRKFFNRLQGNVPSLELIEQKIHINLCLTEFNALGAPRTERLCITE